MRYHGVPLHGCVKAIRREESGLFRVGIRWLDTRREASVSNATANHIQIAHYFSYIDMYLKCDVLEELGDNIAVKLWDGSTFEICVSRIRCRTIERRQTEIFEKGYANILAGLYELGEYETAGDLFDGVLNFEFSASQLITSA